MRSSTNLLACLCLLLGASAAAAAPPEWKEVVSTEGRFAAQFPIAPKQASQTMATKLGNLEARLYTATHDEIFFAVAYVDYPRDAILGNKPGDLLDGARDGAVANVRGKLLQETTLTLAGFPGRELTIAAPTRNGATAVVTVRLFLVRERLYQALVVVDKKRGDVPAVKRFLDSFRLEGER